MIVTSRQNSLIKQFRKQENTFDVEGAKLVSEALSAGFLPQIALFTQTAAEKHAGLFGRLSASETAVITDSLAEYISDTKSPQGVFVKFERNFEAVDFGNARRVVILDGVRDPGNAGAIVRSCEAFGFDSVVFSESSADIYNSKVIRAAAGSAFRMPTVRGELIRIIPELKRFGFTLWATASDKNAVPVEQARSDGKTAIIIGSEGQGVCAGVLALCDGKLCIPVKSVESLNAAVAAGIICYELGDRYKCQN